jgi:hypothetical protein
MGALGSNCVVAIVSLGLKTLRPYQPSVNTKPHAKSFVMPEDSMREPVRDFAAGKAAYGDATGAPFALWL